MSPCCMLCWIGLVVFCQLLNCSVAGDGSAADLLNELRNAPNKKEAYAMLAAHVLGISAMEFNKRRANASVDAVEKGFLAQKLVQFLAEVEEELYYDEFGKLMGQEEFFNNLKPEIAIFWKPFNCFMDKVTNKTVSYFNCNEEAFSKCYQRQIKYRIWIEKVPIIPSPECIRLACLEVQKNKSSSWYTDFITNKIWKSIDECEPFGETSPFAIRPCEGFLPLQWTTNYNWCDQAAYECVDRSDEGKCNTKTKLSENTQDKVHYLPVAKPDARGIQPCPTKQTMDLDGVYINGTCVGISDLCEPSSIKRWVFNRQQIAICRNKTFWEERNSNCGPGYEPCNGNYPGFCTSFCPDNSERRYFDIGVCKQNPMYFTCKDHKFCIKEWLVCDGYTQCEDGSDEDPTLCSVCPKEIGWPRRTEQKRMRATLPCNHRYIVNRTICSPPCDGIDDLCANYADEDNCKIPGFLQLLSHVASASLLSGMVVIGSGLFMIKLRGMRNGTQINEKPIYIVDTNVKDEQNYHDIRASGSHGQAVQNFALYLANSKDIQTQRELCLKLFRDEETLHQTEGSANIYIMQNWGSNDIIGRCYDLRDMSIFVKIQMLMYHKLPRYVYNLMSNSFLRISIIVISNFVKLIGLPSMKM